MSKTTDQEDQEFRKSVIKAGLAALPGEMRAQAEAEPDGMPSPECTLIRLNSTLLQMGQDIRMASRRDGLA